MPDTPVDPLISILMPVKNASRWLPECLDSIRAQTYPHWEVWAIDDGSSDESAHILEAYASRESRIHWLSAHGSGIRDALQQAWEHTTGTYITRMDADDRMPPGKLDQLFALLLDQPLNAVATGHVQYFGENPISEGYRVYEHWLNERCTAHDHWDWIYRECVIASPNWLTHRNNLEQVGLLRDLEYPEDYDLVLYWYRLGCKVRSTNTRTHEWREHPDRTSRLSDHYSQEAFFRLKLRHWITNEWTTERPVYVWGNLTKGKLTARFLHENNVPFQQLGLADYQKLEETSQHPLVLVTVYPGDPEREALEAYLHKLGLHMGRDWWYL